MNLVQARKPTKPLNNEEDEEIIREKNEKEQTEEITAHDSTSSPTYSLGTKLEETVERILKGEGYSTEHIQPVSSNTSVRELVSSA
jgi:hypothetical protein